MESEIERITIDSDLFDRKTFQEQLERITKASEAAQQQVDYSSAHNDHILRAIEVVEDFLRKKHRLCYGGQAINAHLPSKYRFYDPETSIPDYDFFTPQQEQDIAALVKDLRKAGFTELSAREGMHEGTVKIYVDYIPVADMTAIDPRLYRILSKREYRLDGISYLDGNSLRMLMYLELSRPRGEVSRWEKVYERLALFNEFVPSRGKSCRTKTSPFHGTLNHEQTSFVMNYIIHHKRIFAGADLISLYEHSFGFHSSHVTGKSKGKGRSKSRSASWILRSKKPILFFSNESDNDAKLLRAELSSLRVHPTTASSKPVPITIKSVVSKGVDLIPSMKIICQGKQSLVFIIDQTACHSYFNIPVNGDKILRIASMDTLIALYFSLGLLDSDYFDMGSMECLANQLVDISVHARERPNEFAFPFISLTCTGHQTTLPSLIRAKLKRMTVKKQALREAMREKAMTVRNRRRPVLVANNIVAAKAGL
jgi:hypothetical protein